MRIAILGSLLLTGFASLATANEITGHYIESRTCQVYTGPCFANAEVGLSGKNAVMAWTIEKGQQDGVDLTGLSVVMAVDSSNTLGFRGLADARRLKAVLYVDDKASESQRDALVKFARQHAGPAGKALVRIESAPIEMALDEIELKGKVTVGRAVKLVTRKARPEDCICSNESAYYPPLAKVGNFAAGVTTEGEFKGRGLGAHWSTPGDRSAYMATFTY